MIAKKKNGKLPKMVQKDSTTYPCPCGFLMIDGFALTRTEKQCTACRATPVLFVPHAPGFACKPSGTDKPVPAKTR